MKCIIIEDEPIAAEILAEYVAQTPFLELTHICHNALAALEVVRSEPVDVLFLDINLPKLNGLEFLKSLRRRPKSSLLRHTMNMPYRVSICRS